MLTNELKKGARIKLRNGWYATVMDNAKGNTRMCAVEGVYNELGSVYSHDILMFYPQTGPTVVLTHTPAQVKLRQTVAEFGL
jgi:hypothetical protein